MSRLSKIWVLCLALSVLFSISACSAANLKESRLATEGYDFRKAHWGDTVEDVRKNAAEKLEGVDDLSGEVRVCGYKAEIEYFFLDGKLHSGIYIIDISNIKEDQHQVAYNTFAAQLTEEYGSPILVLENMAAWENTSNLISLLLDEDEFSISIMYMINEHDFHNSDWGDTQSDVINNEQNVSFNPFSSEDLLAGRITTDSHEVHIAFGFTDKKLTHGLNTFHLENADSKEYLELYSELKKDLGGVI